jgi:hypothetical protein
VLPTKEALIELALTSAFPEMIDLSIVLPFSTRALSKTYSAPYWK